MDNLLNFIFEYNYLLTIYTDDSESKWNICAKDAKLISVSLWKSQKKWPEGIYFYDILNQANG